MRKIVFYIIAGVLFGQVIGVLYLLSFHPWSNSLYITMPEFRQVYWHIIVPGTLIKAFVGGILIGFICWIVKFILNLRNKRSLGKKN
jgi:hypothetical protein